MKENKRYLAMMVLGLIFISLQQNFAQDKEPFGKLSVKSGEVANDNGLTVAGYVGWKLSNNWLAAIGANFLTSKLEYALPDVESSIRSEWFSVGLLNEYHKPVLGQLSLGLNVYTGIGYLTCNASNDVDFNENDMQFVFEPGVVLIYRFASDFALTGGFTYRRILGLDHSIYENEDFSGFQSTLGLEVNL